MAKLKKNTEKETNWNKFFGSYPPLTNKEKLIKRAHKRNLSVYASDDDLGSLPMFRKLADESVLQERLEKFEAIRISKISLFFSFIAVVLSIVAILKNF